MRNKISKKLFFTATVLAAMTFASCGSNLVSNKLNNIEITHAANKLVYELNESADYAGLEVTAHYTMEPDSIVPHNQLTFTGFSTATAGAKTIVVGYTYKNVTKTDSFVITVNEGVKNVLTSIEITHPANKLEYDLNESADYEGLEVTAHFSQGADLVVPHNQLTFTGFSSSSEGPKTINVSYTFEGVSKSTSFTITVINPQSDNALSSIEITKPANQLEYRVNDEFSYDGLEVTAHFTEAPSQVVSNNQLTFTGFSSLTAGEKTINVSYTFKGVTKSTSYTVTVYDDTNVKLDFYGFNDRHGVIMDCDYGVGIAKTSTFLKNQTAGQHSLLVSSGDMWQGTVESNSNHGELMTRWMKLMNFTSMTVGNHEFDWGTNAIKNIADTLDFPMLGINVIDKTTGLRADYVSASTIVNRGGAKIGIIGAIGDCYSSVSYSKVMDVEFVVDKENREDKPLTALVTAEANRLREEEGCDFIVYSFHGDSVHNDTYYNPVLSTDHIVDVVFEGHKHAQTTYQDVGGVWHFQSQAEGQAQSINHFSVDLNTATDEYEVTFHEDNDVYYMNSYYMRNLEEDPETLELINEYDFSRYRETLGLNSSYRTGDYLRQLCSDLYLEDGLEKWSSLSDKIVLAGGYISIRGEGHLPVGAVNYAQLNNLFPFDNDVLLMKVNGTILKNNFINTANTNYFLSYTEYGLDLKNAQGYISYSDFYYIVTDTYTYDYLYKGTPSSIEFVENLVETGYYARDILADYARDGRFNDGGGDVPIVEHDGTLSSPYSISDAVALTQLYPDVVTWGYFKGVVTDKPFNLVRNYFEYVELQDENDAETKVTAYKLHRHDGDINQDNVDTYGFTDVSELPAGSELLMYGGIRTYNNTPQFTGVNIVITVDGQLSSGTSVDNPISITNFVQAMNLGLSEDVYFYGRLTSVTKVDDEVTNITIYTTHSVDYGYSKMQNYCLGIGVGIEDGQAFSYADGLSADDYVEGADVVIQNVETGLKLCKSNASQKEEGHAGTIDDPYSVSEALKIAAKYPGSSAYAAGAPYIYCSGIVCTLGDSDINPDYGTIGHLYIKDPNTNEQIMIYYLNRYQGAPASDNFSNENRLSIGDEIVICGQAFYYNSNILEFSSGTYCVRINNVPTGPSA